MAALVTNPRQVGHLIEWVHAVRAGQHAAVSTYVDDQRDQGSEGPDRQQREDERRQRV
jgi:hypothetical protein